MIYCPDCGSENDATARFCDNCGRRLDDAREVNAATQSPLHGDQKDAQGRLLADDGLPVGDDLDGLEGGERVIWKGRPSKLWSPRLAMTTRYKLTNQRLIMEFGFVGRRTEEIDLFRVNDVAVKQHAFERISGIGDIYVSANDSSSPVKYLLNIDDPDRVKDLVREAARQERQRRRVLIREDV